MKPLLLALSLALLPTLPTPVLADEPPEGTRAAAPGRVLWTLPEPMITLPLEDQPSSATVEFPAVATDGKPVALRFRARFHWPSAGGLAQSLGLRLNDQPLGPENAPVINRDLLETTLDMSLPKQGNGWWLPSHGWSLLLHYSSAPDVLEPRIVSDIDEGHWYLIQIDGVLTPGKENRLEFTNHAVTAMWEEGRLKDTTGIVIEYLTVVELENLP